MTQWQYRELCRLGVAEHFGLKLQDVQTRRIPSPTRRGRVPYALSIDLVWVTENPIARYLHIAATFYHKEKMVVEMPNVLLLQQCKEQIGAHKVLLISNRPFTAAALAAAEAEGINLFVLRALFDPEIVGAWPPESFHERLQELSKRIRPVYWMDTVC